MIRLNSISPTAFRLIVLRTLSLSVLALTPVAASAQSQLPPKMQGKWKSTVLGRDGTSTVELVKQDSDDKAQVRVTITDAISYHGRWCDFGTADSIANRSGDSWVITVPHRRCASFLITIHRVEGMQRFEGTYTNEADGAGTVFYEW